MHQLFDPLFEKVLSCSTIPRSSITIALTFLSRAPYHCSADLRFVGPKIRKSRRSMRKSAVKPRDNRGERSKVVNQKKVDKKKKKKNNALVR